MTKLIRIFLLSILSFIFVSLALIPSGIFPEKSYAAWFFFKQAEPEEENFVRIKLPVRVLNRLGSIKQGGRTGTIEKDIEEVNKDIKVKVVAIGNMIQIVFYHQDAVDEKHKLNAKKLSLYRLALSKPEENYGPIIDDIAASNRHIEFLEFDRVEDNIFFQWPKLTKDDTKVDKPKDAAASSGSSSTFLALPVPVPVSSLSPVVTITEPVPSKPGSRGSLKSVELYEREHKKTLTLQSRIEGLNARFKEKERGYLKDIDTLTSEKEELIVNVESIQDSYNSLLAKQEAAQKKVQELKEDLKHVKEDKGAKLSTKYSQEKKFTKKIEELEAQKADMALKLETSDMKVKELKKDNRYFSKRVTKLEGLIRESSYENETSLKAELSKYDEQLKKLKESREKLKKKFEDYIKENDNKETGESEDLVALSSELRGLKNSKEKLNEEFKQYKSDANDELNRLIEKFNATINTLESKNENKKEELSSQEAKFTAEIVAFKSKVEKLQEKLDSVKKEKTSLISDLDSYKSKLASAGSLGVAASIKVELDNNRSELSALKSEYEAYKGRAEKRQSEIEGMLIKEKETKATLEEKLAEVSKEKERLQKEAEEIAKDKKLILAKYEEKEDALKSEINKASKSEKADLENKYKQQVQAKESELKKLREREKKYQEAEAQLELDLRAKLDNERFARLKAEEEVARLKAQREKNSSGDIEKEKAKIVEDMRREAEQQKRLLTLANDEEKKRLKAEFRISQEKKEEALKELRKKLRATSKAGISKAELKAKLEIEMKKKLEEMIKAELDKGMGREGETAKPPERKPDRFSTFERKLKPTKNNDKKAKPVAAVKKKSEDTIRGIPYDVEFKNFFIESGLCDNWITTVYEDEIEVWIGTRDRGVTRFIKGEDNWICYSRLDGLAGDEISSIVKYDNIIYVGTDLGISKFDGINWENIKRYENIVFNNTKMKVHDNILWVAARTMYGGLLTYDGRKWTNKSLIRPGEVLNNITSFDFLGDNLLIGTTKNGIYKQDGRNWETLNVQTGLVSNFIYSLAVDGDDVWIGSCCGLVKYNATMSDITILDKNDGLAHDSVYDIAIDGRAIWFATKAGISMYDGYDFINYKKDSGIADDRVTSILVQPEYVWFGAVGGLIKVIKEY